MSWTPRVASRTTGGPPPSARSTRVTFAPFTCASPTLSHPERAAGWAAGSPAAESSPAGTPDAPPSAAGSSARMPRATQPPSPSRSSRRRGWSSRMASMAAVTPAPLRRPSTRSSLRSNHSVGSVPARSSNRTGPTRRERSGPPSDARRPRSKRASSEPSSSTERTPRSSIHSSRGSRFKPRTAVSPRTRRSPSSDPSSATEAEKSSATRIFPFAVATNVSAAAPAPSARPAVSAMGPMVTGIRSLPSLISSRLSNCRSNRGNQTSGTAKGTEGAASLALSGSGAASTERSLGGRLKRRPTPSMESSKCRLTRPRAPLT